VRHLIQKGFFHRNKILGLQLELDNESKTVVARTITRARMQMGNVEVHDSRSFPKVKASWISSLLHLCLWRKCGRKMLGRQVRVPELHIFCGNQNWTMMAIEHTKDNIPENLIVFSCISRSNTSIFRCGSFSIKSASMGAHLKLNNCARRCFTEPFPIFSSNSLKASSSPERKTSSSLSSHRGSSASAPSS
jgi:hypothetical protein